MSLKKYSLLSIFCYGLVFVSPVLLSIAGIVTTSTGLISATTITYLLGALILLFLYFKQKEPLTIEADVPKASVPEIILLGLGGILIAILLQGVAVRIETFLFGQSAPSENTQNIIQMILKAPAFILATTIGGPIMEELVFRRSILGLISHYSNFWVGAVISSLLFAVAHADGHLLVYFFLGFFFSLL